MRETKKFSARFWVRLQRLPIFYRLLIGNTIVTVLGAVGGTLLTRRLSTQTTALWPMVAFVIGGIMLSVGVNVWIIRQALHPLYKLRRVVDKIQTEQFDTPPKLDARFMGDTDPDIYLLSIVIHEMLLQLENRTLELRALSKQALNAQEEERLRIARGLHDDTGQALSMLIIDLERLEKRIPTSETALHEKLIEARELATHTLTELRNVIYGLRPTMLDDLGLPAALSELAREAGDLSGIDVSMDIAGKP
ncbi:MAG: hypothetical protein JXB38_04980, partial [Anaerolineales bacterium]|nr:hypothetical protein [Anaerolineales bacterium]